MKITRWSIKGLQISAILVFAFLVFTLKPFIAKALTNPEVKRVCQGHTLQIQLWSTKPLQLALTNLTSYWSAES